jgi:hypothetical protein
MKGGTTMKAKKLVVPFIVSLTTTCLLVLPLRATEVKSGHKSTNKTTEKVESKKQQETSKKRKQIIQEAVDAINQTKKALKALEDNKPKEALAALEEATGKLELIIAREPDLALAPIDVDVTTYDLYGSLDSIKSAIGQSEDYLEEGEIQKARSLLTGLASEIVISVTNIPLVTYPDAIKALTPLIDEGKTKEAKEELQDALDTLEVTRIVIPLPVMRAESYLEEAEKLTEKKDRTDEENKKLTDLLNRAGTQLTMAELLGYGEKGCFVPLHEELNEITKKTQGGKSGTGFYDKLKKMVSQVMEKLSR